MFLTFVSILSYVQIKRRKTKFGMELSICRFACNIVKLYYVKSHFLIIRLQAG